MVGINKYRLATVL